MLKKISNLGKTLSRVEQKSINGGLNGCSSDIEMCQSNCSGECINFGYYDPYDNRGTMYICYVCVTEEQ